MKKQKVKGHKKGGLRQLSVRIEEDQLRILNDVAEIEGISVSDVLRNVIQSSLFTGYLADRTEIRVKRPQKKAVSQEVNFNSSSED